MTLPDTSRHEAPLRFGVLTDGAPLASWQKSCLAAMQRAQELAADCWLLMPGRASSSPVAPFVPAGETLRLVLSKDGSLSSDSVEAISHRKLHFILSFAEPRAARALVGQASWGVWQFFLSDGFDEIAQDRPCAVAVLAQLQADAELVRVLKQGRIRSHPCAPAITRRRLEARCAHWPTQVCLELLEGHSEILAIPPVRPEEAVPSPRRSLGNMLAFAGRAVVRTAREIAQELLRHEQWNIGLIDAPISSSLEAPGSITPRWVQRPEKWEFFADPFGVVHEGRLFIFCEYMDYHAPRGRIVAFAADAPQDVIPVDIGPPVHLSYPYLLVSEGRTYCIPETSEANEIALYEAESFPRQWRRLRTIASGAPFTDATVFRFGERWWLAASLAGPKGAESELHLYYADVLDGEWRPHRANPVKVDITSARPAGTPFWKDGVLYRPGQDCSRIYGGRVVINRVVRLTEATYLEECCSSIDPDPHGPYRVGLHTLSAAGASTLIDSKRNIFVTAQFMTVLRLVLKRTKTH